MVDVEQSALRSRPVLFDEQPLAEVLCLSALPLMAGYVRPTVQVIAICAERTRGDLDMAAAQPGSA